jgi:hypothetical protein
MIPVWDEDTQSEFWLRNTDEVAAEVRAVYSVQCGHPETALRRKVTSNGGVQYRHQCLYCGGGPRGPVAKSTVPDPDRVPLYDDEIHTRWLADRERQVALVYQKHIRKQKAEKAEWWRWYNKYLQSTEWRVRRDLVMARAEGVCEGCRSRPAVQVHHLTYDHVGNEFLWELAAVCNQCHDRAHEQGDKERAA